MPSYDASLQLYASCVLGIVYLSCLVVKALRLQHEVLQPGAVISKSHCRWLTMVVRLLLSSCLPVHTPGTCQRPWRWQRTTGRQSPSAAMSELL